MKIIIIILVAALVALGWWLASPENSSDKSIETHSTNRSHSTSTVTDPAPVFQRAFWKHPTPEDHILHAERREWQDKDGISKWQWFIAVKPSPVLVDHLITDNAFMLTASRSGGRQHAEAPDWFPQTSSSETSNLTNAAGTFHLLWNKQDNLLFATDSGTGFRPGAPEPSNPLTQSQPTGRLPTTPPPRVQN